MHFLITNGRKGSYDHVEAVEPGPALDVVKARHADDGQHDQCDRDELQVAEDAHGPSLVVGWRPSATKPAWPPAMISLRLRRSARKDSTGPSRVQRKADQMALTTIFSPPCWAHSSRTRAPEPCCASRCR